MPTKSNERCLTIARREYYARHEEVPNPTCRIPGCKFAGSEFDHRA